MTFVKSVLTASLVAIASADHYIDSRGYAHVRLNKDGSLKIMQLTDLHFGENVEADRLTMRAITAWCNKEKPDFVAVTGDLVSGFIWDHQPNGQFWEDHAINLAIKMKELNIPWGFVPGDHDFEADADEEMMMNTFNKYPLSTAFKNDFKLFTHGMYHQFTYQVPVESYEDPKETVARIWFFGTGRATCLGQPGKDCIRRDQIEWFKSQSKEIPDTDKYKGNGVAFMHHALQEHMQLVNNFPVHGQKRDNSSCQAINTGLYAEMKQAKTVQWVSAGGDHSTDFWGGFGGINLSYGRKSGYSSFGPKFQKRGARILDMKIGSDGKMDTTTWIREDDGSIDNQEEFSPPYYFSWLRQSYCYGSELLSENDLYSFLNNPVSPF